MTRELPSTFHENPFEASGRTADNVITTVRVSKNALLFPFAAAVVTATACATPREGAATPPLVASASGRECKRLGPVHGLATSGPGIGYEQQLFIATQDAVKEAKALRATHVVLDHEEGAPSLMRLSGFAYRCE